MNAFRRQHMSTTLPVPVLQTSLRHRPPDRQGKVRDIYDFGDRLIVVATDRISAFDYVLGSGIPDKGKVLTQISTFWFGHLRHLVDTHLITTDPALYPPETHRDAPMLGGRSMLVRKADPLSIECVARGYLSGSGWKDYRASGSVCGIALPPGLRESDRLPQPIFTPATKAQSGHDINISEAEAATLVSPAVLDRVRELTLRLYEAGAAHAESRGIIVADTKFEFGILPASAQPGASETDRIILIDEALTPDSSRFWPRDSFAPGGPQPSFDKQFVRDFLEEIRWDKQPPVPRLPEAVVAKTREKYLDAFRRLTGRELQ
jgi:phosphoribosylaminoimidazole-succinocarboxamide synthase